MSEREIDERIKRAVERVREFLERWEQRRKEHP